MYSECIVCSWKTHLFGGLGHVRVAQQLSKNRLRRSFSHDYLVPEEMAPASLVSTFIYLQNILQVNQEVEFPAPGTSQWNDTP